MGENSIVYLLLVNNTQETIPHPYTVEAMQLPHMDLANDVQRTSLHLHQNHLRWLEASADRDKYRTSKAMNDDFRALMLELDVDSTGGGGARGGRSAGTKAPRTG